MKLDDKNFEQYCVKLEDEVDLFLKDKLPPLEIENMSEYRCKMAAQTLVLAHCLAKVFVKVNCEAPIKDFAELVKNLFDLLTDAMFERKKIMDIEAERIKQQLTTMH